MDAINAAIERDVRAQEAAYHIARDTTNARQTAFALAMQKYQNTDAARALARAAGLDSVQAQMAANAALWKGTDAANRADVAMAEFENGKAQQVAQGIRFILPQASARTYVDPRTGLRYSEAEAKGLAHELRGYEQKREEIGMTTAGKILEKREEGYAAGQKDMRAEMVTLPNGDTIRAPSAAEATTLRNLSQAVSNAQQLVDEAKAIRSDPSWVVSPTKGGRLKQIESELTLAFKDRGQLGALSGPDMDLARNATADLTGLGFGVEERLDSFAKVTDRALRNRVKTLPDAPDTAKGILPKEAAGDFKAYGKK
jgi:hypothetical protein